MKKTKRILITVISIILFLSIGIFVYYHYFYDPNALNITEKKWLDDNKTNVVTFNMPNDINIFASSGSGVFYNYLDDLSKTYDIKIDKNIIDNNTTGLGFVVSKDYNTNDLLFHEDHYAIISKTDDIISSYSELSGETIGGLSEGISRVSASYNIGTKYTMFETRADLLSAFKSDKVKYIIVPLDEFMDAILENNYKIIYHLNDITNYYYIKLGSDETLNSIVKKYYNIWKNESLEKSYYTNTYDLFVNKLGLSEVETDTLTNKIYTYGFVTSTPYQTLNSSKYGGIIISYLEDFSRFSNVDFTYTKYKTNEELVKAYNNNDVDLIFNNTILNTKDFEVKTNYNEEFYIISPLSNNLKLVNLKEIQNDDIYVLKNSLLANYLLSFTNIKLKYADDEKELLKDIRKDYLVAIDADTYNYYLNKKIKDYHISYSGYNNINFGFKYGKNNDTFYKMFSNYINFIGSNNQINNGIITFKSAESSGNLIATLAKYFLLFISIGALITGIIIASRKHLKLNTKIRKDEKLKFVDMLTSLKNRNYLNERINIWNQNTIYPQAIIVIDLNNIKYLNDTFGHVEGDKQIKYAANILHQTQLDNTEIMRTDGNEFMVYLVGYTEKQVVNYLKKLVKEFNTLPYEYGAAFGFSMIVDDLKLIDDAINEATIQMRENKEIEARDEEKEE